MYLVVRLLYICFTFFILAHLVLELDIFNSDLSLCLTNGLCNIWGNIISFFISLWYLVVFLFLDSFSIMFFCFFCQQLLMFSYSWHCFRLHQSLRYIIFIILFFYYIWKHESIPIFVCSKVNLIRNCTLPKS